MNMQPDTAMLEEILDQVRDRHRESAKAERAFLVRHGASNLPPLDTSIIDRDSEKCRPYLSLFLADHSSKSAEELEELASHLSPGSAHTGGLLAHAIFQWARWEVDPLLLAATLRYCWHGGKMGFQFLPDPAKTDPDEYDEQAQELVQFLFEATDGNPARILTGEDLVFYNSLPSRLTVYRGCSGISSEQAGLGVCWTTDRGVAEWFAHRGVGEPLLITGRVQKARIVLAKASEKEVVCTPSRTRALKCRKMVRMAWEGGA
ncbi:hypothetical protein [Mesorhizobium sp.]|uniref:hypothetical protein n=1 Tax=Mesorhizobium sp. TaxID=1871066 RepID=UPI000FE43091|nr:hypothetical protein [Mesorhizobium sp.]RWJ96992.1 MAG: hypothetical protein EOR42_29375 [Mesorhizobium sp.]